VNDTIRRLEPPTPLREPWRDPKTAPRDGFHFIGLVSHGGAHTAMQVWWDESKRAWQAAYCPACGVFGGDFVHADDVVGWLPLPEAGVIAP